MPTRILIRLSLLAGLVAPLCAFALGVGPLEVRSALNQNFEAEIPLISSNPVELIGLTAQIPRQQTFDWAGLERYEFLSKLRFSAQTPPGGPNVLKITSTEPLREPNFTLLLELVWPRGRLLRAFPVQLDPALYADRRLPPPPPQPLMVPPPIAAEPAAAPAAPGLPPAPPVSFEGATFYGPVKSGETLMGIASQVRPSAAINLPEMMAILVAGNAEAFINGNPNLLRAGSVLKVPAPQALGVQGVPTPSVPDLAAASSPAESALTQPPPMAPTAQPPVEPTMQPITSPPEPTPLPEPPLATTPPPLMESQPEPLPVPVEPLREIVPQASIPQTEREPPPEPAAQPEPSAPVAQPEPAPVRPPPVAKPLVAQPEESGLGWLANPVVWIAIAMIVLAVAAVVLLPLLRRPAKPKQPPIETEEAIAAPQPAPEPSMPKTRAQFREPRSVRPRPAVSGSTAAAPPTVEQTVPAGPAAPKPAAAPPKPIDELLQDIDFGLGDAAASGKDASPAQKMETPRLPDTEPPTASVTRAEADPFRSADPASEKIPTDPQADLPSELRLDNLDFDFGDLGLENTARPRADLPPLELKPAESGAKANLSPLAPGAFEPVTEPTAPPPAGPQRFEPLSMPPPSRQFEFTDVTQEPAPGAHTEPLRLDEDLREFDGGSLDLGKMEAGGTSTPGGGDQETAADYVETKLDLATAFLDMGDQAGARSLLEEALQEGTASQQQQARELLKKLS